MELQRRGLLNTNLQEITQEAGCLFAICLRDRLSRSLATLHAAWKRMDDGFIVCEVDKRRRKLLLPPHEDHHHPCASFPYYYLTLMSKLKIAPLLHVWSTGNRRKIMKIGLIGFGLYCLLRGILIPQTTPLPLLLRYRAGPRPRRPGMFKVKKLPLLLLLSLTMNFFPPNPSIVDLSGTVGIEVADPLEILKINLILAAYGPFLKQGPARVLREKDPLWVRSVRYSARQFPFDDRGSMMMTSFFCSLLSAVNFSHTTTVTTLGTLP